MRNLLYLNGDAMVNIHPNIDTIQTALGYTCYMNENELNTYCKKHNLFISDIGELTDSEKGYVYGTIIVMIK